jgi:indolepyruvate decarboxylase
VDLKDFLIGLNEAGPPTSGRRIPESLAPVPDGPERVEPVDDDPLRTSRMMRMLNRRLDADTIVIADVGDSLFASTELVIHEHGEFLSPAYYTSMGFSVPASLGAATARKDHRIVVLVGDGAFQMTGQELSSLVRDGHAPVVIILDNHGYGTERYLHAGDWRYNEIQPWDFTKLTEVYGGGESVRVSTEGEFEAALEKAWQDRSRPHLIQAKLMENDASETLRKLAHRLGQRVAQA